MDRDWGGGGWVGGGGGIETADQFIPMIVRNWILMSHQPHR